MALLEGSGDVARLVMSRADQSTTGSRLEPTSPFAARQVLREALNATREPGFAIVLPLVGAAGPRGFIVAHCAPEDVPFLAPLHTHTAANLRRLEREASLSSALDSVKEVVNAGAPGRLENPVQDDLARALDRLAGLITEPR
jgi:hypothetical protein